jgi:hypothetical protein
MGIVAAIFMMAPAAPMMAHHGTPASYFMDKTAVWTGIVTEFAYSHPHPQIYFDVKDPDGKVRNHGAEIVPTPAMLRRNGVLKDFTKAGDEITITVHPSRANPETIGLAIEITINGKPMPLTMQSSGKQTKD